MKMAAWEAAAGRGPAPLFMQNGSLARPEGVLLHAVPILLVQDQAVENGQHLLAIGVNTL